MSILTGPEIRRIVERTKAAKASNYPPPLPSIDITPFDPTRVGPNSVDLRLADKLLVYEMPTVFEWTGSLSSRLSSREPNETVEIDISGKSGFTLFPGTLYLGSTMEFTETHGLVPVIETRSSLARLGVSAHLSAGFGDDGWAGCWTLELTVVHPVKLWAGDRICQVAFHTIEGERQPYKGKYRGSEGTVASRMHEDTR